MYHPILISHIHEFFSPHDDQIYSAYMHLANTEVVQLYKYVTGAALDYTHIFFPIYIS